MTKNFDTDTVHISDQKRQVTNSKTTPIYQTSAFSFKDLDELENFYQNNNGYLYTRVSNPNTDELGHAVAMLEGAPKGIATSSGTSAILVAILAIVKAGDHIIAADDIYGGTYQLLATELKDLGVDVSFLSFTDLDRVESAIKDNTKLIYTESLTNPFVRVEDLKSVIALAKVHNLKTVIDNTFASPYLCKPLELGADLVIHSATKYIGGHSDVTSGVVVGNEELVTRAQSKMVNLGASLSPYESWLTCRGLKTLGVRMERHVKNAQILATGLEGYPGVNKVYYPTNFSDKGHGAIVTIDISEHYNIDTFFKSLKWIKIVPTLGGVETTVSYPIATSHRALPKEMCEKLGITKGLVRVSVGIEDGKDILNMFKEAINCAK